jgi:hypothetical protein
VVTSDGGPAVHTDARWAAEQVLRQHESGRCKQCVDDACPMLGWAQDVLGDRPVAYPRVEPAQPVLTG